MNWLLGMLKPLVKWQGKIHWPFSHKIITGQHYYVYRDLIKPGTVLLTKTYGELSNVFNPAELKHAGLYLGMDERGVCWVLESLGKGVTKQDLVSFLLTKDEVVALDPIFLSDADRRNLVGAAEKLIGVPYDYLFEKGKKALYCFETVLEGYKCLREGLEFKESSVMGAKKIYDHNTFLQDPEKFKLVLDSRGKK